MTHVSARRDRRKSAGRYDTPAPLAALVAALGLDARLDEAARDEDPCAATLALRVCDPTCGAGNLLVAAARRIASQLARVRHRDPNDAHLREALRAVVTRCVYGVERDAAVATRCRRALADLAGLRAIPASLRAHVRVDDALAVACDARWAAVFPSAMAAGGFDAVLGNPPFLNAIERRAVTASRARLRALHPEVGATADVAFHALAIAASLRRPRGRCSVVMPRALLSAPSAAKLRATLAPSVRALYAPGSGRLFEGAQVFVCVVCLGDGEGCVASVDDDPARITWRPAAVRDEAWWRALVAACDGATPATGVDGAPRLGDRFEVRASMTTSEAYAITAAVVDAEGGEAPALVTTGLIDRDECHWGARPCRYLGRTLRHPRLRLDATLPASVHRRVAHGRRPKVLVAGLGRRVECFVDAHGRFVGAVSTWTITHPRDDLDALHALAAVLHGAAVDARLRDELGATALTGGSVTITRRFLDAVPLPEGGCEEPVRGPVAP
jgi:hypothetical protein